MKSSLLVIMFALAFSVAGCGAFSSLFGDDSPLPDIGDGEPEWDTDGEGACGAGEGCDAEKFCDYVCDGEFNFISCVPVIMKSLPVGKMPRGSTCSERCESVMFIYTSMAEQPDYDCLGKAANCSAVASCLGVTD